MFGTKKITINVSDTVPLMLYRELEKRLHAVHSNLQATREKLKDKNSIAVSCPSCAAKNLTELKDVLHTKEYYNKYAEYTCCNCSNYIYVDLRQKR
jgi:hypothetical protein